MMGNARKNITLSADEALIEAARAKARTSGTTLNAEFRTWLQNYVERQQQADRAASAVDGLRGKLRVGSKLTRDAMHGR